MNEGQLEAKRWLRKLREDAELTQAEVAELLGVHPRTIGNLENEDLAKHGFANGYTIIRYLRALGVVSQPPVRETDASVNDLLERAAALLLEARRRRDPPPEEETGAQ